MNKQNMEEMIDFPVLYTFKAMGEKSKQFESDIESLFVMKEIDSIIKKESSKGTYLSISVTVEIEDINELESYYKKIKSVKGLKYHL